MGSRKAPGASHADLGRVLGVSARTIKKYRALGAPIAAKGPFDVGAVRDWIDNNMQRTPVQKKAESQTVQGEESLSRRKLRAEVRIKEAQADQEEAKRDKLRGALVTVAEARKQLIGLATTAKQHILAVPRASADRLVGIDTAAKAEAVLTEVLSEALESLSRGENDGDA